MTIHTITTSYQSHPGGSNVGNAVARLHGTRRTVRFDQSLYTVDNYRRAAEKIAALFNLTIVGEPVARANGGYLFTAESS